MSLMDPRVLQDLEDLPPPSRAAAGYGHGATLDDIAAVLGVNQERGRQIEAKALAKCADAGAIGTATASRICWGHEKQGKSAYVKASQTPAR